MDLNAAAQVIRSITAELKADNDLAEFRGKLRELRAKQKAAQKDLVAHVYQYGPIETVVEYARCHAIWEHTVMVRRGQLYGVSVEARDAVSELISEWRFARG